MAEFRVKRIDDATYARFKSLVALEPRKRTINDVFLSLITAYVETGEELRRPALPRPTSHAGTSGGLGQGQ